MADKRAPKFPKEFKKQKLSSFDSLFAVIVLLSLLSHVGMILYFKDHLPFSLQPDMISKIQQRYANLLLDRDSENENLARELNRLAFNREIVESSGEESAEALSAESALGAAGGGRLGGGSETALPTAGEMAAAGRGGRGGRGGGRRTMSDVAAEVGAVGVLNILTSGSGLFSQDYINGVSEYGQIESERLRNVLSSLDAIRVGKGPQGEGWGTGFHGGEGGIGDPIRGRAVRGTRRESRALSIEELIGTVEPKGQVSFDEIERNQQGFGAGLGKLDELPTNSRYTDSENRIRRKPEFVQSIIARHSLAVQDCYKRELRNDPDLKGKVEVRFRINSEGKVVHVEILNSTIENESLVRCLITRINRWNDFGTGDPNSPDEIYRQSFTFGY